MKKIATLILLFAFATFAGITQTNPQVAVTGKASDFKSDAPLEKVTITIYKNGQKETVLTTDAKGSFPAYKLDLNHVYRLVFHKKKYIDRIVEYDLRNIPKENHYSKGWEIPLNMTMVNKSDIKSCKKEFNTLNKTVTSTVKYSPATEDLDWDMQAIENMRNKLKACSGAK